MSEVRMLIGKGTTGDGDVIRLPGRFKQFLAHLDGAADEETAVAEIYVTPDGDADKGVLIATLTLSGAEPGAISPIVECLAASYFARVVSIDGGAVWIVGVNE